MQQQKTFVLLFCLSCICQPPWLMKRVDCFRLISLIMKTMSSEFLMLWLFCFVLMTFCTFSRFYRYIVSNPLWSVVSTVFCNAKSAKNKLFLCGDFRPISNKNVLFWDHFFLALFPKDLESQKSLNIRFREVGTK